jgi:hypothetical protein
LLCAGAECGFLKAQRQKAQRQKAQRQKAQAKVKASIKYL